MFDPRVKWRDDNADIPTDSKATDWRDLLEHLRFINRKNAGMPGVVRVFLILHAEALTENHPATEWFDERHARLQHFMAQACANGITAGESTADVDPDMRSNEPCCHPGRCLREATS